ncbi:MAG TPA: transcriptional regulator [Bacteroidetes bacterium]|nr:transcriptional regulator [Bacteroidota bacterium]
MEYQEAKEKFLQAWGTLGGQWGINRTMAQIHALLLIAPEAMTAQDIQKELQISVGNTNMNLRALIDWGLVFKKLKTGHRKEFFVAEKDMWEVVRKIIAQRKRKELEPVVKILDEVSALEGSSPEVLEFKKTVQDIHLFTNKANTILQTLLKEDADWFIKTFLKMV